MTLSWIVAKILSASHGLSSVPQLCSVPVRLRRALVHHVDLGDPRVGASREADLVLRALQVEVAWPTATFCAAPSTTAVDSRWRSRVT